MNLSVAAAGLPGRYAAALFDLARSDKALDRTAADLATVKAALAESADFRMVISSGGIGRDKSARAVAGLSEALGLSDLVRRFLGVVAANGRLAAIPGIVRQFEALLAAHKGTTTARVTAAHPLSTSQVEALESKLKARTGRPIAVDVHVDPAILGGLVVRIGSEQIDTSIRTRLDRLGQHMKGQ